ncbi:MAG TPA: SDR family oxidoreductase [Rhodocyclaceae bacterium]|nr:SDR family oxidoreductase [Rhodocyclaceae bacterium]
MNARGPADRSPRSMLITGGTGLLGIGWACAMRDRIRVHSGTHHRGLRLRGTTPVGLDLESVSALCGVLAHLGKPVIVHTAGLASVDQCDRDPSMARHVNADLAENVAIAAAETGCRLIHISTDHLFAGDRALCGEDEPPQPLNRYAETKREAEVRVLAACPGALVVRTNFFGWGSAQRRSFSDWILDNLRTGQPITLFDDVYYSPILIETLAIAAHQLSDRGISGVINLVGDERVSKHEFGVRLAARFRLDGGLIARGKISSARLFAPRPRDMSLDNRMAREILARPLGGLDQFFNTLAWQESMGLARELNDAVME